MDLQQLQNMFKDHQLYHSDLQIDSFITLRGGGNTEYGQYKQALRELHSRYRGLKDLYTSKALLLLDIEELEEKLPVSGEISKREDKRSQINLTKKKLDMEDLELNIKETEREFCRFYALANALKQKIGDITPDKRAKLDMQMWEDKLKTMAALDYVVHGHLGSSTIELVQVMPKEQRQKFLDAVGTPEKVQGLVQEFYHSDSCLPSIGTLPDTGKLGMLLGEGLPSVGESKDAGYTDFAGETGYLQDHTRVGSGP